ncbi:MAG: kynureninase [Cyclobacteriaceae bacterium]|nr:kynureninase [Cyclobacteriaceae bacterium]UYN87344.1 MAG: kynureninase [Cyclobacteriaceae bacterium]
MKFENSLSFAKKLDKADVLKSFRNQFEMPTVNGKKCIYFTGNSLGLQPKSTKKFVNEELTDWAKLGVEGHLHSRRPWLYYHKFSKKALAQLVGAKPIEVVAMNQLTVNLHLMMVSFYRPTKQRFKIIVEAGAFSSDQYAFESQLKWHNQNPAEALVELSPRKGENTLRLEDILTTIEAHASQLALVIFGGVQYYTGQFFNIKKITEAAHKAGAHAGFDLAHTIGNVPLNLHGDGVDFAVWCSYKYLNSGPGGIAGAFIHERHAQNFDLPRFSGWWGHHEKERFQMKKGFIPMPGVDGWQLSNFPVLSGAAHLASLEIFQQAGIKNLRKKSLLLTGYLEFLLSEIDPNNKIFTILTPSNPRERGCQLSVYMKQKGKEVFKALTKAGVVADWREPNVIRVAPVPLYNTFEEVFRFAEIFRKAI